MQCICAHMWWIVTYLSLYCIGDMISDDSGLADKVRASVTWPLNKLVQQLGEFTVVKWMFTRKWDKHKFCNGVLNNQLTSPILRCYTDRQTMCITTNISPTVCISSPMQSLIIWLCAKNSKSYGQRTRFFYVSLYWSYGKVINFGKLGPLPPWVGVSPNGKIFSDLTLGDTIAEPPNWAPISFSYLGSTHLNHCR